jgi:hypothetical protein
MSSSSDDAVAVAEQLLALVKARAVSQADSREFYDKGIEVQATCDRYEGRAMQELRLLLSGMSRLLRSVVGPLEYTALMAG